ncbi:MAG: radical SAM protein [Desulfobulbaceae bacterium]|jgi:pyruvate formate-lyase activating enzyme-like uncharacterized protein|nr:radical SAM protein [Desulfobulbaceae bacterium]
MNDFWRQCLPSARSDGQRQELLALNEKEYGLRLLGLNFPGEEDLSRAVGRRADLLASLADLESSSGCRGTKLDMNGLAPGCRRCVAGSWSCLFINGRCNGACFYCPARQDETGQPGANGLEFAEPEHYVRYLERFAFTGASISGGEPLLTPERTLAFVAAIKKHFGVKIHLWLYTNGILATHEMLVALADAGLDEIRFDIGATAYHLDAARLASGLIPTVTVEIPAIPEEEDRLKNLLPRLGDAGVKHLNLHQLRLTPYNYERLQPRGYRWLHGEKIVSIDSELTALAVLEQSLKKKIGPPVNYCSFPYKYRFQGWATRRRNALFLLQPTESVSDNGFLRSLILLSVAERLDAHIENWRRLARPEYLWQRLDAGRLRFHPDLFSDLNLTDESLLIQYRAAYQHGRVSKGLDYRELALSDDFSVFIEEERAKGGDFTLGAERAREFFRLFVAVSDDEAPLDPFWQDIADFERPRQGLQEYF